MIPLCVPHICGNEWSYIKQCLDSGWVSSAGSFVSLFEEKFKEFVGAEDAVATVNGTSALHLALRVLGIGEGDEVIVPSMTFIAPVNAVKYVGAVPVFADVCRDTYVMDASGLEELISERTKAILPVHIYGHPVDMDEVMAVARKFNLYVVEDATESLGSKYKGSYTGTIGHIGVFSFNGNKLITTGAGGMLVTRHREYGEYARYLSAQTKTITENGGFYHKEIGFNYRMPNLLAAMGVAQLEKIEKYIETKIKNAQYYSEKLSTLKGISLPTRKPWAQNVHWLYSVLVEDGFGMTRDELILRLKEEGIETRPFFMPVHLMPPYRMCRHGGLEVTLDISKRGINLPSSVGLIAEEIDKVCHAISCARSG